ncbi:YeiH family putative sulfate export transporter [Candidimonas sp. SYP-B2681]|nr:YeiH family protein [Candidimonas sp. SYP-B2681]RTZ48236.1 YeiH family putative sulfate export transporter [Candidimonas sp. SYP-B2681]
MYGLALATTVAVFAMLLGRMFPLVGGPVFGILLGIGIRNTVGLGPLFRPGLQFASRHVLQWSIIALGFGLSVQQVVTTGMASLSVTLITIGVAFGSAYVLGKWLKVPARLKVLIGAGTAICGGSAIAAVAPIIKAEEHETAFAIATIFIFNIAAVLTFPFLGHWLGMSDMGFGTWAGTAINDTSSVVAAGYSFSHTAGDYATIVKLTRATLIIPVCLLLLLIEVRRNKQAHGASLALGRIFPWFIVWFLLASAIRSTGLLPENVLAALQLLAQLLIIVALTAIGLSSDLRRMAKVGAGPVLLGLGVWVAVAGSSLVVQHFMGNW